MHPLEVNLEHLISEICSLKEVNIQDCLLLYSNKKETLEDIDIIIIVPDGTKAFQVIKKIVPKLVNFIKENQVFVACFPIEKSTYESASTQFIKNIKQNGTKLKTTKSSGAERVS